MGQFAATAESALRKVGTSKTIIALILMGICLCAAFAVSMSLYSDVVDLKGKVGFLTGEVDSLNQTIKSMRKTRAFVFEWMPYDPIQAPKNQKIINGTLRMELNFTLESESLLIIVKVNDDHFTSSDGLAMAFDRNGDGILGNYDDQPVFILYACNQSLGGVLLEQDGTFSFSFPAISSPYHNCTFSEAGYVFTISTVKPMTDAVHVNFGDSDSRDYVFTRFHFGLVGEN